MNKLKIKKIISGGQTGADIAGLMAAKQFGIPTGGWMPFGFKTLSGAKPEYAEEYGMKEHESSNYAPRTYSNVRDSDGTIRLAYNFMSAGELCTFKAISYFNKPYFDVDLNFPSPVEYLYDWMVVHNIAILNVAGNSESTKPGIQNQVYEYLCDFLNQYYEKGQ